MGSVAAPGGYVCVWPENLWSGHRGPLISLHYVGGYSWGYLQALPINGEQLKGIYLMTVEQRGCSVWAFLPTLLFFFKFFFFLAWWGWSWRQSHRFRCGLCPAWTQTRSHTPGLLRKRRWWRMAGPLSRETNEVAGNVLGLRWLVVWDSFEGVFLRIAGLWPGHPAPTLSPSLSGSVQGRKGLALR